MASSDPQTTPPTVDSLTGWHTGIDGVVRFVLRDKSELRAWTQWLRAQAEKEVSNGQ